MRIIAGSLKGRRMVAPAWTGLRPTSDKLRETLFNVLGGRVTGARVVDGFAGTGAVGLEAISRGAAQVVFVEADRRAIQLIAENVRRCGVVDRCVIIRGVFQDALIPEDRGQHFDLVFLDPPYDEADLDRLVARAGALLSRGGLVILEHATRREPPGIVTDCELRRTVVSGDSALTIYQRIGGEDASEGVVESMRTESGT